MISINLFSTLQDQIKHGMLVPKFTALLNMKIPMIITIQTKPGTVEVLAAGCRV